MGKPFKLAFTDPDDLQEQIDDYFDSLWAVRKITNTKDGTTWEEEYQRPPTMAGLAHHLGVVRATLFNYTKRGDEDDAIRPVILRALNKIAAWAEEALYTREGVTGARFSLEVNHRYGREDEGSDGGAFKQTIIAPIEHEADAPLAIPRWGDDDE